MDKKIIIRDIIVFILEMTIGIIFLIAPDTMTKGIIILLGVIAIILGLRDLFTYCSESAQDAAASSNLVTGIAFILIGLLCTIGYVKVYDAVALYIPTIFGALLLIFGLTKLQRTIDYLRLHIVRWWINAIIAGTTIVFAAIILWNPFDAMKGVFIFIGVSFIVEAVFTLAGMLFLILMHRADKRQDSVKVPVVDSVQSQGAVEEQNDSSSTEITITDKQ